MKWILIFDKVLGEMLGDECSMNQGAEIKFHLNCYMNESSCRLRYMTRSYLRSFDARFAHLVNKIIDVYVYSSVCNFSNLAESPISYVLAINGSNKQNIC